MAKIRRNVDNIINYTNKKLEQFRLTFGKSSAQYHSIMTRVQSALGSTGLISRKNGVMKIKRSNTANNIHQSVWETLALELSTIDYKEEKRAVMSLIRQTRRRKGMTQKEVNKRITVREIKEMSEQTWQMDSDLSEAIDFFYNHKDEPETVQAMSILKRKGRKTYGEIGQVLSLARDLQTRLINEQQLDEPVLSYTRPDSNTGISRWDTMQQRGLV